jgi:DNA-directed RNA polymerase subunit RPC12/RpoP
MPEISQTPPGSCPTCQTPMRLWLIEPRETDHEKRMYRCDSCGHSETTVVAYL